MNTNYTYGDCYNIILLVVADIVLKKTFHIIILMFPDEKRMFVLLYSF